MAYRWLGVQVEGDVATVTLDDPATLNAASPEMAAELAEVLRAVTDRALPARAVVLTGAGRAFCSGANLSRTSSGTDMGEALERVYHPLVTLVRDLPVPLVTAVRGAAAGIGCSLALLGDLVVAAESAYFLQAFRHVGLVPDGGATYLLPRLVGRARAMEMVLLGERIPAATALAWGLVNRCVPDADLVDAAQALARSLAAGPASLAGTRRLVWQGLDAGWAQQLDAERAAQREAGGTQDFAEGVAAFRAKRPPEFRGR